MRCISGVIRSRVGEAETRSGTAPKRERGERALPHTHGLMHTQPVEAMLLLIDIPEKTSGALSEDFSQEKLQSKPLRGRCMRNIFSGAFGDSHAPQVTFL